MSIQPTQPTETTTSAASTTSDPDSAVSPRGSSEAVTTSGPIAVSGSIATDHLMSFAGKFSEQFVAEHLDHVSLSFLVNDLNIRRGGVAGNIAFALGVLGEDSLLVGAVGEDFGDYRTWLESHGVDCSGVRVSADKYTARFVCTTDTELAQLASFYPGAMSESAEIHLADLPRTPGLVLIGAGDPTGMVEHTRQAREAGIPFAADPSQQLSSLDAEAIEELVTGAAYLFTNEYELGLMLQRTGWTTEDVDARVGVRVTTLGSKGAVVVAEGVEYRVDVVPPTEIAEPTGVGDGFRAGFLAAHRNGADLHDAARVGALVATHVLETVGTQEWPWDPEVALSRFADAYGAEAAERVAPVLRAGVARG